jgi:hypothetical protein
MTVGRVGWILALNLVLSTAGAVTTIENSTGIVSCGPRISFICEAAAVPDQEDRQARLLQALAQGLESSEPEVREESFHYLAKITPFAFDPRPLHRSLARFDELGETHKGTMMLEEAELSLAPRDTRIHYYRIAIVDGRAAIGTFAWIPRLVAMEAAATEGLGELRDLVAENYPKLDFPEQAATPLYRLLAEFELRDGAQSYQDAAAVALRRLTGMPPSDLSAKIESNEGWREALSFIKLQLCAGGARDRRCGEFNALMGEQGKLFCNRHPLGAPTLDATTGRPVAPVRTEHERRVLEWFASQQ